MIDTLKKNIHILIVTLYGYILFYKIKKKDYTSMILLTLFTAILILQLRKKSIIEGQEMGGQIDTSKYVDTGGEKEGAGKQGGAGKKGGAGKQAGTVGIDRKKIGTNNMPLKQMPATNENVKALGEVAAETTEMNMKLNDESKNIKTFDDSIRIGAYDGLCLSSIQKQRTNEIITNEELNTYFGHHLPRATKKTSDDILSGPSVDGSEGSPTKLSIFANNKTSLNCCGDSPFSTTTGCVCLTEKQKKFIQNRGFNKQYEEI